MEDEYEMPVDFGDDPGSRAGGDATTASSLASSSRVASAFSAPANLNDRNQVAAGEVFGSASLGSLGGQPIGKRRGEGNVTMGKHAAYVVRSADNSAKEEESGNSYHSSPIMWNATPQRSQSRREMERKIRHRNVARNVQNQHPFSTNFPTDSDAKDIKEIPDKAPRRESAIPKALTDIFLQTALLGIDTTAKLSKPTLAITKNTLLPQFIIPLLKEIWEQYVPQRLQTWFRVVPSSLRNAGNLLWDTEPGQELFKTWSQLADNIVDMASSEVSRQCWIDFTVILIKIMESLHTPEFKALLDQGAVGMCRFVDVFSSGKAKQVWFDISDTIWALVEVGSDPLVVSSLAEGCAQICFALENERDSLKTRRSDDAEGAAHRRRERDRRQMETYPPGKAVVVEGGGEDNVKKAFLDSLGGCLDDQEERNPDIFQHDAADDGPPKLITPTSPIDTTQSANAGKDKHSFEDEGMRDDESEITTDIEDLHVDSEKKTPIYTSRQKAETTSIQDARMAAIKPNQPLSYEDDGNGSQFPQNRVEARREEDDNASEVYDTFDESILQFYRRLNQVLSETRKQAVKDKATERVQSKNTKHPTKKSDIKDNDNVPDSSADANNIPIVSKVLSSSLVSTISKNRWKIVIVTVILGMLSTCMLWFALGCYGFYMLFIDGSTVIAMPPSSPVQKNEIQQPPSNIVINIIAQQREKYGDVHSRIVESDFKSGDENANVGAIEAVTISLEDWEQLKSKTDAAIDEL